MSAVLPEITVTATRTTYLNTVPAVSASRQPRGIVQLGPYGQLADVPGSVSWSVTNNSYYEADTFRVTYAASALPATKDANWFSDQTEIFAQIYGGFPSNPANPTAAELTQWIYGRVDGIEYDPVQEMVTLTGRDLTAAFIDSRISDEYKNQTSSQIATALAAAHGLDTSNITATTAKVGTYYNNDQILIASNRSEWDLLCYLARQEGFVIFVSGNALYFEPDPRPTNANNPYLIKYTPKSATNGSPIANVVSMEFSRSLTVAKGISVTVRSPNLSTGKPVVQSYPSTPQGIAAGKSSPFGAVQQYYFTTSAGKTPTECAALAESTYQDIISHEMKMTAHLPADDLLTVSTPILVQGTGTNWDQLYFPRLVTREMSIDDGYSMTVEAQNTNPDESPDT